MFFFFFDFSCFSDWLWLFLRCINGICVTLDAQSYRCNCKEGYYGTLCNLQGEPAGSCQGLPCTNGQCQQTQDGLRCLCEPGYTGESCEVGERGHEWKDHSRGHVTWIFTQSLLWDMWDHMLENLQAAEPGGRSRERKKEKKKRHRE